MEDSRQQVHSSAQYRGMKFRDPWEPPDNLPVCIAEIPVLGPALPQDLR